MSLDFWVLLWKVVLTGGIGLFGLLAVVVTIGGARDIAKLLRQLKSDSAQEADANHEIERAT